MSKVLLKLENICKCFIVNRENGFVVRVEANGKEVRAYINNTGRLLEYLVRGRRGFCLPSKGKKTRYRLFAIEEMGKGGVN